MTDSKDGEKSFRKGRLIVSLDRSQVFPDDPGNGTPAMVHSFGFSATYWCAQDNGLENRNGEHMELTDAEVDWLGSLDSDITEFLYRT